MFLDLKISWNILENIAIFLAKKEEELGYLTF